MHSSDSYLAFQIIGFSMSVVFYAMMRQSRCWELDLPVPSMLTAVELNLRVPVSFLLLALAPVLISLVLTVLAFHPLPPFLSFITVSLICYTLANGFVVALILIFQLGFYVATTATIALKLRLVNFFLLVLLCHFGASENSHISMLSEIVEKPFQKVMLYSFE